MRFTATLTLFGKTATGIVVPPEVVEALGQGKRPPVRVTINGFTYRSTVTPMSGQHLLPVSAENRAGSNIAAGQEVEIELEPDLLPREMEVPQDLQEALDANLVAKEAFAKLSYSNKRGHVEQVTGAKTQETRDRRIQKVVAQCSQAKV